MGKTVPERVAAVVAEHTRTVFGLMGNGNAWFIHALAERGVEIIPVRHEAAAVAAADAHHRTTRRLAVATTTYGPGFSNALTPLIDAALNRSPLLLVAGADDAVDQAALAGASGVQVFTAGPDAAGETRRALETALRESAPVVLFLPSGPEEPPADPAEVSRLLSDARRPLVLAGRGAVGARAEVVSLAEALGADVATTAPAKGFFRGARGVRDLGICGGFAFPEAAAEIRAADVVLVVGASLNPFTADHGRAFGPDACVVQIDRHSPTSPRVDAFLRGDASDVLPVLACRGVAERSAPLRTGHAPGEELAPDGRLDPRGLFGRLNEVLPQERVVVTDGGHFIAWPCMYLDVPGPDHLVLVGTAFESIGLGFGSAVGVVEAAGERLTVLVTGDGGGLMALADAESVIRRVHATGGRCVIVVVNDAAYGAEVHQYGARGVTQTPMLIPEVDFASLLGVFGARGTVVRTWRDLDEASEWLTAGGTGTWVLDCRVSRGVVAPFLSGK
ncbi:thiamine pyrophosphate-binding protein [Corynebacterium marinum]|uniref:acetolactate synthase n=1 Tax=Corynebacterium marinum DSM 44953 TaxID=1224162 RepID=A0A0B6TUR6_9CORY|nr:thiamine pyrophosphate-binding protein [Corynebacterium marinum]AJK70024.1 thiamine pyrophosphate binding domain-containing protein [Corynebacterium marinum DSM 44953]GGO13289.1 acetolactate synthase I/II/III large subunit [Corynebacterium marinum]